MAELNEEDPGTMMIGSVDGKRMCAVAELKILRFTIYGPIGAWKTCHMGMGTICKRKREQSPNKQTKRPKFQLPPNWNNNDGSLNTKGHTDLNLSGGHKVVVMYNKRRPSEECPELAYLLLQRTPLVPRIFNNERLTTISEVVPTNVCLSSSVILSPEAPTNLNENNLCSWDEEIELNELIEKFFNGFKGPLSDNEAESGFCFN
ncbi:hypothetical protein CHUAL_010644 [Chamberlinius hualienensis]